MGNILFLFEGASTERKYYSVIEKAFKQKIKGKPNFFYYKTNIHVLYNEIKDDEILDTIEVLKEKAKRENNNEQYNMLNENKFGEIYLIFDLDPHDFRFNSSNISKMLQLFNDETGHGKLYINYPMVESFKHFKNIPDAEYNDYKVKISDCNNYKRDVAKLSCINDFRKITKEIFNNIVKQNLDKVSYIINGDFDYNYKKYIEKMTQSDIFECQKEIINYENKIYVVNSFCFWTIDYFGENIFKEITE